MKIFGALARVGLVAAALALPFSTPEAEAASAVKGMKAIPCPEQNGRMFFTAPKTEAGKPGLWFGQPCAGFGAVEWGTKAKKGQPAKSVYVVTSGSQYSWDTAALKAFAAQGTPVPTKVDWVKGHCCTPNRHDFDAKKPDYLLTNEGALMPWKTPKGAIFDTLGPGNSFNCCNFQWVTSPGAGHPANADQDVAQGFEVPAGRDVVLKSLDLALSRDVGANVVDVYLTKTKPISHQWGGFPEEPDLSAAGIVESWRPTGLMKSTPWSGGGTPDLVVHLDSAKKPLLKKGERYWLVLSVPEPSTAIRWYSSGRPEGPVYWATRNSAYLNAWESHGPAIGGYGLRITTRAAR